MANEQDIPEEDKRLPTLYDLYHLLHHERDQFGNFVEWRYKGSDNDESMEKFVGLIELATYTAAHMGIDPNIVIFSVQDTGFTAEDKPHNPPIQYAALLPDGKSPLEYMIMIDPQFLDNTSLGGLAYGVMNGLAHAKIGNLMDEENKQHTLAIRAHEAALQPNQPFKPMPNQRLAARYTQMQFIKADKLTIELFNTPEDGLKAFDEYRQGIEKCALLNDFTKPVTPARYSTKPTLATRERLIKHSTLG